MKKIYENDISDRKKDHVKFTQIAVILIHFKNFVPLAYQK